MHCAYLLSMSEYFMWIGLKSRVQLVLPYVGVRDLELSLGSREPEGDERRVKHKARVQRSELRTRETSNWYAGWAVVTWSQYSNMSNTYMKMRLYTKL